MSERSVSYDRWFSNAGGLKDRFVFVLLVTSHPLLQGLLSGSPVHYIYTIDTEHYLQKLVNCGASSSQHREVNNVVRISSSLKI